MYNYKRNVSFPGNFWEWRKKSNKYVTIMKYSFFFLVVGMLQAVAAVSYSQTAKLTLDMADVTVAQVISQIENESQFYFTCNTREINPNRIVSVHVQEDDIHTVMQNLFAGESINYIVTDKHIVLYKGNEKTYQGTVLQGFTITGTVIDAIGEPLPGVSVMIKGTTQGTATDANGAFSLQVQDYNAVLVFSYIGFVSQERVVGNQRVINVTLSDNARQLEEVVVIGFGSQKKVNLTGAVGTVSATELQNRPVQNVIQALQGLVPGLNIQNTSGFLDNNPGVNIRGTGNLGTGSSSAPLVLIDGVENDLKFINPQDIENISVLKDAAASSIYGSRAPFGVILITTKKGATGQTRVNYNNNFRWGAPTVLPKMMDSYTMITFMWDAADNAGTGRFGSDERLQRIKDYMNGVITTVSIPDPTNPAVWANGN
jgi:TonB-dependent SusC/RagA subfamily outer membrane receptor